MKCILLIIASMLIAGSAVAQQPNVIMIYIDDMGQEMFNHYAIGTPAITWTDTLDAFDAEGIVFQAGSSQPSCTPSRVTLLTGTFATRLGVGAAVAGISTASKTKGLSRGYPTVLHTFRQADYEVGCFGKWHLIDASEFDVGNDYAGEHPIKSGCSVFKGSWANLNMVHVSEGPNGNGYWSWSKLESHYDETLGKAVVDTIGHENSEQFTEYTTDAAIDFMQTAEEPYFIYLAPNMLHSPFNDASIGTRSGANGGTTGSTHEATCTDDQPTGTPTRDCYYTMLAHLDYELGLLKTAIEAQQAAGQVVHVYISSDNGTPGQITPRTGGFGTTNVKASAYMGGNIVPFIAWGDQVEVADQGVTSLAMISNSDMARTIAKVAGLDFRGHDSIDASGCVTDNPETEDCTSRRKHYYARFNPSVGLAASGDMTVDGSNNEFGAYDIDEFALAALGYEGYIDEGYTDVADSAVPGLVRNGANEVDVTYDPNIETYRQQGGMNANQWDRYRNLHDYAACVRNGDGTGLDGDRTDLCHERADAW